jgi:hypothetical protein
MSGLSPSEAWSCSIDDLEGWAAEAMRQRMARLHELACALRVAMHASGATFRHYLACLEGRMSHSTGSKPAAVARGKTAHRRTSSDKIASGTHPPTSGRTGADRAR